MDSIFERLRRIFSVEYLAFDPKLLKFVRENLDNCKFIITLVFVVDQLLYYFSDLTNDEALVILSIKKHDSLKMFEISDDFTMIKMLHSIDFDLISEIQSRSLYIENIPHGYFEAELQSKFPSSVVTFRFPYKVNPMGKSLTPLFAFVTMKTISETRFYLMNLTITAENAPDTVKAQYENVHQMRVLSFNEWQTLCNQYQELSASTNSRETGISPQELEPTKGVVCQFFYCCRDTNIHILRKIFELVSPVAFIDFEPGENRGYVRFKSRLDARRALNYFTKCHVYQNTKNDLGSLEKKQAKKPLALKLIQGSHEKDYWKKTKSMKKSENIHKKRRIDSDVKGEHVYFSE